MSDKVELEIFLAIDENGNWSVGKDPEDVISDITWKDAGNCIKSARITVQIRKPAMAEFEVDVPDEEDEAEAA